MNEMSIMRIPLRIRGCSLYIKLWVLVRMCIIIIITLPYEANRFETKKQVN
jgi:hypothetical protein